MAFGVYDQRGSLPSVSSFRLVEEIENCCREEHCVEVALRHCKLGRILFARTCSDRVAVLDAMILLVQE